MKSRAIFTIILFLAACTLTLGGNNWPQWRGPTHNGVSDETNLPLHWSTTENIQWKLTLPGRSGSTPIVWGDQIFVVSTRDDQIIISCKVSRPGDLIAVYRDLARRTRQPLHLGLTEAGMGVKGLVWSASAMGILLNEGIGDTIRVSLTPRPGGDRREEVHAACELLQAMGLRAFAPSVTACPGCGRTTSTTFQELAERIEGYVRGMMPEWKTRYEGVEEMTVAVMGCVVNGPGESKAANIGISLPGTGEAPTCPVFIDGRHATTLRGSNTELAESFRQLVDAYVEANYAGKSVAS